ncbi:hypothetical protein AB0D94_25760 [Streptomyces sp. NPDC048255]|uniref:hypothetical protein n=1 Tax=Streptomyces sp. NPDC048255 TaxID=3154713 RepID=UPI0033E1220B
MKFRRMAVVAAAAVVGPTVLTATPAMAEDRAAVSVPDVVPGNEGAVGGALTAGAPGTKAAAEANAIAAPRISVDGIPENGFKPGGSPTKVTLRIDNSGQAALPGYSYAFSVKPGSKDLKTSQVKVERWVTGPGGGEWRQLTADPVNNPNVHIAYFSLGSANLAADQIHTVDLRVSFAADTPAGEVVVQAGGSAMVRPPQGGPSIPVVSQPVYHASRVTKADEGGGSENPVEIEGPLLGLQSLPQDGFQAGTDWREFALHVDNSGRDAVDDFQLDMILQAPGASFGNGDIMLEVFAPDASGTWGWHRVVSDGSEDTWVHELAVIDIVQNESFDLKLRMKFVPETAGHAISLRLAGQNGWGNGTVHSPSVTHDSKITSAPYADPVYLTGPKVTIGGIPQNGFQAGGEWQVLTARVDNTGKQAFSRVELGLEAYRPDGARWTPSQVMLEVRTQDADGNWSWKPEKTWDGGETLFGIRLGTRAVAADEVYEVQFRLRFAADTPPGDFAFFTAGLIRAADPKPNEYFDIDSPLYQAKISTATGTNHPLPSGGSQPVQASGDHAPTPESQTAGGRLADTGTDPAAPWALAGAGLTLAMGAALVAGTGRHRRRTTA